jgi:hypothetical protein
MFENLNDENFLLFAAKYYENPSCVGMEEFKEDLNRIKYIKRLFNKYEINANLKERLILNHIIVLYNVFHPDATTRLLCYRLYDYIHYLKPFLIYLNYWPDIIKGIDGKDIVGSDISMDQHIISKLRKI